MGAMLEVRLARCSLLKKVLEAIKDLLSEAILECSEEGISLKAMDSAHASLVFLRLRSDGFDDYRCEGSMSLGVNVACMAKIMRCADGDDALTLRARDDADAVAFTFESATRKKVSDYEMKLIELEAERAEIPATDHSCAVQLPSGEFQRICHDLSQIGGTMVVSCRPGGVEFSAAGRMGSGKVSLVPRSSSDGGAGTSADDGGRAIAVSAREPVSQAFACRYLNSFARATPLAPRVRLSMSAGTPLVVEYELEGGAGRIGFYLAPKIEDGD